MGRRSCCSKEGVNKGAWSATEDKILYNYITIHGEGKWRDLAQRSGLKRCGKSCRLRWLNYLRPGIKRGNITHDEEDLIIRLHKLLGNRWSLIAGRLPGRTDNEIKNYWNSNLCKKVHQHPNNSLENKQPSTEPSSEKSKTHKIFLSKATRCTKVVLSPQQQGHVTKVLDGESLLNHQDRNSLDFFMGLDMGQLLSLDIQDPKLAKVGGNEIDQENRDGADDHDNDSSVWPCCNHSFLLDDKILENWWMSDYLQATGEKELSVLGSFPPRDEEHDANVDCN